MPWLVKSEEDDYSIAQLKRDRKTRWTGVRNYQARNYLQEMRVGEAVLFYHSNANPSGIVGIAKVTSLAGPDETQFDRSSDYYDPKASKETPRWFCPELGFVTMFPETLSLETLRKVPALCSMVILQKGSRLSVTPVTDVELKTILKLATP